LSSEPRQPDRPLHLRCCGDCLGSDATSATSTRRWASWSRAVRVAPDQALFHFNLGAVRRQTGRLADAEAALRQTLALAPILD